MDENPGVRIIGDHDPRDADLHAVPHPELDVRKVRCPVKNAGCASRSLSVDLKHDDQVAQTREARNGAGELVAVSLESLAQLSCG